MPGIPVRVHGMYRDGRGPLQARLGGVLTIMDAGPPELDEGELLRYLAEAPFYPTALLPAMGGDLEPDRRPLGSRRPHGPEDDGLPRIPLQRPERGRPRGRRTELYPGRWSQRISPLARLLAKLRRAGRRARADRAGSGMGGARTRGR